MASLFVGEGNGTPLQYSCLENPMDFLAWKIPGIGCSPWGRSELDTTEQLHFHFSLWCIREGNGNPLQCSCLENSRDGGAWWAVVRGVAQSWTQLKQLSSSSSLFVACWSGDEAVNFQGHHLQITTFLIRYVSWCGTQTFSDFSCWWACWFCYSFPFTFPMVL